MSTFTMPACELPLNQDYDVIVVGGGPAGCTAAAAAAREGAKTLLIEATGALGGMGTSALVPAWCPFSDRTQMIYRGLAEKVFRASQESTPHEPKSKLDWVSINAEALKRIYDDLVTAHGAEVLFHTALARVMRDEQGYVRTIVVNNKFGLTAYSAKIFIDCTGDADLTAWAGNPCHKGNATGERLMPATHCFVLSNVDDYAYRVTPLLHPGNNPKSVMYEIASSGKYPQILDTHCCDNIVGPGTVGFNAGHLWGVDNTNPLTVSKALIQGRKVAAEFQRALAEHHPAFKNSFLVLTGSLIGIRETRRIVGDYELTLQDYLDRRSFPDEICRNCYFIDVHTAKEEINNSPSVIKTWEANALHYGAGESHGIPYRCLTPRDLKNVLVAGRSISCEQIVQGSVRVMPVCLAMGEAAGLAGAIAAKQQDRNVHEVDVADLRARLRNYGAYLP